MFLSLSLKMWDFYEVDQKQGHHKKRKRVLKTSFMDRTKNFFIFIIFITRKEKSERVKKRVKEF